VASRRFRFLNDAADFSSGIDWPAAGKSRLWRYHLHYFHYLLARGDLSPTAGLRLMEDWVTRNPPGTPDAWDPFPVSLRLVNWLKYLSGTVLSGAEVDRVIRSACRQCLWLERLLERHLLANHLFKNLKALVFAGLFFQGPVAERWLATGARLLVRELSEQVLPDGGHFERSPMYHAMILEDCLDLLNVLAVRPEAECRGLSASLTSVCHRMGRFLAGICHPDGEIALFNDSALGSERPPSELLTYGEALLGEKLGSPDGESWSFPDAGYHVLAPESGDWLAVDCGPVGPDYQPGHAHCDTLSYELSLRGRRVVVDSGVHDYDTGDMRRYVRSTAAHNTVLLDCEEQSEIWGAFRVGRRARPIYWRLESGGGRMRFVGAHDGYRRLDGVIHEREIGYSRDSGWTVKDRLTGKGRHRAQSFVHLHPDLRALASGHRIEIVERNGGAPVARVDILQAGRTEIGRGCYCPEFGLRLENDVIRVSAEGTLPLELTYRVVGSSCTSSS
jgi:uncharacterized heparinase superfamily protein